MKTRTEQHKKNLSKAVQNLWNNPEYRAKMVQKQKELGYRTYNETIRHIDTCMVTGVSNKN
jgi:DNA polymerase III delta subunit